MALKLSGGNPNPQSWKPNRKEYPEVNAAKSRIHSGLATASSELKKAAAKKEAAYKKWNTPEGGSAENIELGKARKKVRELAARKSALQKTVRGFTK